MMKGPGKGKKGQMLRCFVTASFGRLHCLDLFLVAEANGRKVLGSDSINFVCLELTGHTQLNGVDP